MSAKDQAPARMNGRGVINYALIIGVAFFAARMAAGIATDSLSLVSLAVFAGIDILRYITRPWPVQQSLLPLKKRPNPGFNKIPAILGMTAGVLLILAAVFIFRDAGRRLDEGLPPSQYYPAIAVLVICLTAAFIISLKTGKTAPGTFHPYSRSEFILSLAVLVILILVQTARFQSLEPVASIFIAIFVLFKSLRLLLDSLKEGLDNRLPNFEVEWIRGLILTNAGSNYSVQNLSARRSGHKCYIDFRLAAGDSIDLETAFETANKLEKELIKEIPGAVVIIHVQK
jgi:cation diffusion facilitator family transporter